MGEGVYLPGRQRRTANTGGLSRLSCLIISKQNMTRQQFHLGIIYLSKFVLSKNQSVLLRRK